MKPILKLTRFNTLNVKLKHPLPAVDDVFVRIAANHDRESIYVSRRTVTQEVASKMTGYAGVEFYGSDIAGSVKHEYPGTVQELDQSVDRIQKLFEDYWDNVCAGMNYMSRGSKSGIASSAVIGALLNLRDYQKELAVSLIKARNSGKSFQPQN